MSQHHALVHSLSKHTLFNRDLEPTQRRALRLFLRLMGYLALATCLLFWLNLLV